jgi:hypothetical protein
VDVRSAALKRLAARLYIIGRFCRLARLGYRFGYPQLPPGVA